MCTRVITNTNNQNCYSVLSNEFGKLLGAFQKYGLMNYKDRLLTVIDLSMYL